MARRPFDQKREEDSTRVNEAISASKVRLVDADGTMLGVVDASEAMEKAVAAGMDLVEVSPNADPPVCKILDYGKYKYELQKKAAEARKKQKTIDVKEVKIRPAIEQHDYEVKMRNARRFLEGGDKVKISMRFRGREMAHQDIGMDLIKRMLDELEELGTPEQDPKMEGRQVIVVLAPTTAK